MKYLNLTKQIAALAISALVFASCDKVDVQGSIGDSGQTLVKILGGGDPTAPAISSKPIDFVTTPTVIIAAEIRRDIPNATELNTTMNVVVKDDNALVAANGYVLLPAAWYTIGAGTPRTGGSGGNYNIVMAPGEFSKTIYITIPNATLMDPSIVYALGFTITSADDNGVISNTQKSMIVEIGAKNIYDGVYSYVSGFVQRYSGPGPTNPICCDNLTGPLGPGNDDVIMATVGAATVEIPASSQPGRITWSYLTTPNSGVAGIDGLRITVDPATNLTTEMALTNATLANWPGHTNSYVPATKTFNLAFWWNPVTTTRQYECVLKYKGPR